MITKTKIDLVFDDSIVPGLPGDIKQSPVIPNGKIVRVLNMGWSCPLDSSIAAIQFGSGGSWNTFRGGYGNLDIKFTKGVDFVGDGVKRFRLIRINAGTGNQVLVVWFGAVIL